MALLLKQDGTAEQVQPAKGKRFSLPELQAFVGGYIEHIRVNHPSGKHMLVNEEGLLTPKCQLNEAGSEVAGRAIVGDVLICNDVEFN